MAIGDEHIFQLGGEVADSALPDGLGAAGGADGAGRRPATDPRMRAAADGGGTGPELTGRYLVLLRPGNTSKAAARLKDQTGVHVASSSDFAGGGVAVEGIQESEAVILETLGVAVVNAPPDQAGALNVMAADEDVFMSLEPERVVYALFEGMSGAGPVPAGGFLSGSPAGYVRGYRDGVQALANGLLGGGGGVSEQSVADIVVPQAAGDFTWGLVATGVPATTMTGLGIGIAVLDTGMDLTHPDFAGRQITSQSFVTGEAVQDGHGHGTHCIGVAAGTATPGQGPRYGIACDARIFAGKVLSNLGRGVDGGILAGIEWAITQGAAIVSMSLGSRTAPGTAFSPTFETAARRALAAGTLIVAAAGNDSQRPSLLSPVSHPANCPSILSVAALDINLNVATFSNSGVTGQGGQVDICGPGVDVRSSWPAPTLYRTISGTSMATPHVAGLAAIHLQANPAMPGAILGWLLMQSAKRLPLASRDAGAGLVQAP